MTVPILSVVMKSKKKQSYYNLFELLKIMIKEMNIKVEFINIYIWPIMKRRLEMLLKNLLQILYFYDVFFIIVNVF